MTLRLNPNLLDTSTPPIPEAYAWSESYGEAMGPLINMAQAAPSSPPHPEIIARIGASAGDPAGMRYGSIPGDLSFREAFAIEQTAIYGGDIGPDDVAITAGCNLAFFATILSLARAGEAVILPAPWYFNHEMALKTLGIEARRLQLEAADGFVPQVEAAERLIDDKVRAIVLVTPNNPTGAVYPGSVIRAFADLCRRRNITLVLDETYRDLMPAQYDRPHTAFADPAWRQSVIQLYSFSKSYCIPGLRLGAITADRAALAEIGKALDSMQICAPRPAQAALTWAIPAMRAWREANRAEINARADAFRKAFAELNDWHVASIGAYFAYVRHPYRGVPSRTVIQKMAQERGVLGLPGSYFGPEEDDHLRIAFANTGIDQIAELPARLRTMRF
ncbi:MAG: aminotransferase [Hyphomicrobiaceae bacterium]